MNYKKIVIAGGGILGSQIAFQSAYCGFDVTILIRDEDSKDDLQNRLDSLCTSYLECIDVMDTRVGKKENNWARGIADIDSFDKEICIKKAKTALKNLKIETNQEKALDDVDLVIESITENIDVKKAFYTSIANIVPEKTVIVTNSSTLLPSKLAKYTGRPNKFLSLHFANLIWKNNIAEIMGHKDTDEEYFNEVVAFAEAIRMIPLTAKEEKAGYLLNSMLVPFLLCAMDLVANGVSDPETIDKAWTLGTGAPAGPFQIIDVVGLITARNIVEQYQKVPNIFDPLFKKMLLPYNYDGMLEILNKYIDEGKLGKSSGEGFYKYEK